MEIILLTEQQSRQINALNSTRATLVITDKGNGPCVVESEITGDAFAAHRELIASFGITPTDLTVGLEARAANAEARADSERAIREQTEAALQTERTAKQAVQTELQTERAALKAERGRP